MEGILSHITMLEEHLAHLEQRLDEEEKRREASETHVLEHLKTFSFVVQQELRRMQDQIRGGLPEEVKIPEEDDGEL